MSKSRNFCSSARSVAELKRAGSVADIAVSAASRRVAELRGEADGVAKAIVRLTFEGVGLRYASEHADHLAKLRLAVEASEGRVATWQGIAETAERTLETARQAHGSELRRITREVDANAARATALRDIPATERSLGEAEARLAVGEAAVANERSAARRNPLVAFADRMSDASRPSSGIVAATLGRVADRVGGMGSVRPALEALRASDRLVGELADGAGRLRSNLAALRETVAEVDREAETARARSADALSEAERVSRIARHRASQTALARTMREAELEMATNLADAPGRVTLSAFGTEMAVGNRAAVECALAATEAGVRLAGDWTRATGELASALREHGKAQAARQELRDAIRTAESRERRSRRGSAGLHGGRLSTWDEDATLGPATAPATVVAVTAACAI